MISNVSREPSLVLRYSLHKCMVFLFSLLWWNAGEKAVWGGDDLFYLTVWETTVHLGGVGMGAAKWDWLLKSRWIRRGEWQCPLTVSSPPEVPKPFPWEWLLSSTSPEHSKGHIQGCTLLMPQVEVHYLDPSLVPSHLDNHGPSDSMASMQYVFRWLARPWASANNCIRIVYYEQYLCRGRIWTKIVAIYLETILEVCPL